MNKRTILSSTLVVIIFSVLLGYLWYIFPRNTVVNQNQNSSKIEYINDQYGFRFTLPQDWKEYSIVEGKWEGNTISEKGDVEINSVSGPMVSIRNPKWTQQKPYQDIPIMIFTLQQWDDTQRDKFHIGAAPINPSMLNFNDKYVFALPARYNFAFAEGFQQVEQILKQNPLQPLQPTNFSDLAANSQTLICAGIPNGSTVNIKETSRLFVNLPKSVYKDKANNIKFKVVSGIVTAGYVSNAGPYGEAFQATPNCWSYYFEFNGSGELNLSAKSGVAGQPDYSVNFIIK